MFDSIAYTNAQGPGPLIDIGAIAESLLFYGKVAIVGNTATLKDVLAQIPPFILLPLMRQERIEFHYLADQTGVSSTQLSNGRSIHGLVRFSSPQHTIEKVGPEQFMAAAGHSSQAKIAARQFTGLLRPIDHAGFDQTSILQALSDNAATEASVDALIRTIAPNFQHPGPLRFRIEQKQQGFYVDTNIDFASLNELYHKVVPPSHSSLTEAYLLALIQGAYASTYFAGVLNSEIAVSPIEKAVQASTIDAIVRRHSRNASQIEQFTDLVLVNAHSIREAINSGAIPFASIIKLLDSADKFRHWLRQQPADENLVKAYYQEIVKDSWVDKLPGKSVRWGVFTGAGLVVDVLGGAGLGTASAIALSAVDAFLADKLLKGWKPHQFVESDLKSLLDSSRQKK
jgi:hypothetical protein